MPVTEAVSHAHDGDVVAYELAYHILPTVAEGEVDGVTEEIKAFLTSVGATITDEEAAARFELAYEIEKYLEGKYRRFASAYFGWIRFSVAPDQLVAINEAMTGHKKVLRYLVVRLTATEASNPFRFHEAVAALNQKVTTIETEDGILDEADGVVESVGDDVVTDTDTPKTASLT